MLQVPRPGEVEGGLGGMDAARVTGETGGRRHPHRDGAGELGDVAKPPSKGNHSHPRAPKRLEGAC